MIRVSRYAVCTVVLLDVCCVLPDVCHVRLVVWYIWCVCVVCCMMYVLYVVFRGVCGCVLCCVLCYVDDMICCVLRVVCVAL